jgi:hypothetical protein
MEPHLGFQHLTGGAGYRVQSLLINVRSRKECCGYLEELLAYSDAPEEAG